MQFGSTINPALGRTDYSAYTQGAAQGAQAIGQGIQQLGAGIGGAIKDIRERNKKTREMEGQVKASAKTLEGLKDVISSMPESAQTMYVSTLNSLNDPSKSLEERSALSQQAVGTLKEIMGMGMMAKEQAQKNEEFGMKKQMLEDQVASQNKQNSIEAARNALILGRNPVGVYSPEVLNAAEVGRMEFEGKMAPKSQDAFQTAKSAFLAQNPNATPAQLSEFVSIYQNRSQPKYVLSPSEQAQAAGLIEGEKLSAKSTQDRYDALNTSFENADKSYNSAVLFEKAASGGKVSQGAFAEPMLFLKKAAEASGIAFDVGATESSLAKSGIAGLQTTGVRAIMNGLGSMSNSDREFAVSALPSITNPAKANEYFKELAKENKKFADEDRKFIRQLERNNVKKDEILRQLDERTQGREVASTVYDRVIGNKQEPKANSVTKVGRFNVVEVK